MTVVEYDGRIVVVDTGLMFPTAGPARHRPGAARTSPTCASAPTTSRRSCSPTATRTTWARCRSCCARSARTPADLRRPADRRDGALQARRAQAARTSPSRTCCRRRERRGRPVRDRDGQDGPLDPGRVRASRSPCELGTMLMTGDYKFDQTPVDGVPADVARLAELGREGLLLLCGDSTNADRPGVSPSESSVGPRLRGGVRALPGPDHRHLLRLEHPPRPAGGRRRGHARPARWRWSAARCARTSTSAASSVTSTSPRACSSGPQEIEDFPDEKLVIISTG